MIPFLKSTRECKTTARKRFLYEFQKIISWSVPLAVWKRKANLIVSWHFDLTWNIHRAAWSALALFGYSRLFNPSRSDPDSLDRSHSWVCLDTPPHYLCPGSHVVERSSLGALNCWVTDCPQTRNKDLPLKPHRKQKAPDLCIFLLYCNFCALFWKGVC